MTLIRVSVGTASQLGLCEIRQETPPTTGYLLTSGGCARGCQFCPQSGGRADRLSRVRWPEVPLETVLEALGREKTLKRLCLQVSHSPGWEKQVAPVVSEFSRLGLPVCISASPETVDQISQFFDAGVERVTIPLDAATPELYQKVKRGEWVYPLLIEAAQAFPGRIGTHLIAGMGETEEEILRLMGQLLKAQVLIALFAFTPVQGTPMAQVPPPPLPSYRRVQIGKYLLEAGQTPWDFGFDKGRLAAIPAPLDAIPPIAFQTSGCPDCNRPYYNERPGRDLYNYPRPLTQAEWRQALLQAELGGERWTGG